MSGVLHVCADDAHQATLGSANQNKGFDGIVSCGAAWARGLEAPLGFAQDDNPDRIVIR